MALQKKIYRNGRKRFVEPTSSPVTKPKKDYSQQIRSYWGAQADAAMARVQDSIKRSFSGHL